MAHEAGVPLIVDNTLATPYLIRPLEWGADVVVHSATKYLGGHGSAIAGVIVDGGNFDFTKEPERFPGFNTPDPSYNGLVYGRDLGANGALGANLSYILKARVQLLRDLGSAVAPFNAFLIAQGLETLSLRVERHVDNAVKVATWLEGHDDVESVAYAGLPSSPWFERGRKYGPKGTGAVVAFNIKGGAGGGQALRRRTGTALACGQPGRRPFAGDPSGLHHARTAQPCRAAGRRCHPGAGPALGWTGKRGGHPCRPGRGVPGRQGRVSNAGTVESGHPVTLQQQGYQPGATVDGEVRSARIGDLPLEAGGLLPDVTIAYETWGTLNADASNAVLVQHALTGSTHVARGASDEDGWWEGLVGPGKAVDTDRYFVVAANMLGGCYGTTGPSSIAADGKPWGARFPFTTIRDSVHAEARLADLLGDPRVVCRVGRIHGRRAGT